MITASHGRCRFEFTGDELMITSGAIERRWQLRDGLLYASSLIHLLTKTQWIKRVSPVHSPFVTELAPGEIKVDVTSSDRPLSCVQRGDTLVVTLSVARGNAKTDYRFQVFDDSPGVTIDVTASAGPTTQPSGGPEVHPFTDVQRPSTLPTVQAEDLLEAFELGATHLNFIATRLIDQTDMHDNLVLENEYMLTPAELLIQCTGDVFAVEDILTGNGLAFVKHAPTPHAQPIRPPFEAEVRGRALSFHGHGIGPDGGGGYPFALLTYSGGREGRIAALQQHQLNHRDYVRGRDGTFLTNTWGDRSRETRINESFITAEIESAAHLGADVMQIDDGWQTGTTGNTRGGALVENYWSKPDFWTPNRKRLPHGLESTAQTAKENNIQLGLWFGPDSFDDFANWQRDVDKLMEFHTKLGINYFKLDTIKTRSKKGERNLQKLLGELIERSNGQIVLDVDVTTQNRPGYFGAIGAGTVFVENRYTDWHRYWPHQTLRNLWQLSQYVNPVRLRMEFLNNARNLDKYPNDPIAPAKYDPSYLFATVMVASPLGWFEASNLPRPYVDQVASLVKIWKQHRDAIFGGTKIPIGQPPDGTSWTGFLCRANDDSLYALIFRELNAVASNTFSSSLLARDSYKITPLFGPGRMKAGEGKLTVELDQPLSFMFARLT